MAIPRPKEVCGKFVQVVQTVNAAAKNGHKDILPIIKKSLSENTDRKEENWHFTANTEAGCVTAAWPAGAERGSRERTVAADMPKGSLKKELRAAELLSDALVAALRDKDQFRRYIVTDKRGSEAVTEERLFDKVDIKAIGETVRTIKALEELKRSVSGGGSGSAGETGGLVILPMLPEKDGKEA